MKMTRCNCDICGKEIYIRNDEKEKLEFRINRVVQVIIKYGNRVPSRAINHEHLDVCIDCVKRIYEGETVWSYEKDKYTFERCWLF